LISRTGRSSPAVLTRQADYSETSSAQEVLYMRQEHRRSVSVVRAKQRLLAAAAAVCAVILSMPAAVRADPIPGDMARTWLFHMLRMEANPNFIEHTRLGAMTMVAIHDAVNSINGVRRYKRYLNIPEQPIVSDASPVAAVAAAAYEVLESYRAEIAGRQCGGPPGFTAAQLLAAYTSSLASIPDGPEKEKGTDVGRTAGQVVWNNRVNDGWRRDPCTAPPIFAPEHYDTEQPQPTVSMTPGIHLSSSRSVSHSGGGGATLRFGH